MYLMWQDVMMVMAGGTETLPFCSSHLMWQDALMVTAGRSETLPFRGVPNLDTLCGRTRSW